MNASNNSNLTTEQQEFMSSASKEAEKLLTAAWSPSEEAEHNDFLDRYINGEIPRYKDHLDLEGDNWEDELNKHPLFMTRAPTEEEIANNPEIQAMAQIIYDEMDDDELAEYNREQGNAEFKKGTRESLKKALELYTKGISYKPQSVKTIGLLYGNRSQTHLKLGNYRFAVEDCERHLKCDNGNIKAFYRSAMAYNKLNKQDLSLKWCDRALEMNPEHVSLLKLRSQVVKAKAKSDKEKRVKERSLKAKQTKRQNLIQSLVDRGYKLSLHDTQTKHNLKNNEFDVLKNPTGEQIHTDEEGNFYLPTFLLYPEYDQSDFIAHFNDMTTFRDHFEVMFPDNGFIEWDINRVYRKDNLDLYYAYELKNNSGRSNIVQIPLDTLLLEVIRSPNYEIMGGVGNFIVIPKRGTDVAARFRSEYFKKFEKILQLKLE